MTNTKSKSKPRLIAMTALAAIVSVSTAFAGDKSTTGTSEAKEVKKEAKAAYREAKSETKEGWQKVKRETAEAGQDVSSATRNAWLHGKLETTMLLNRHLNSFEINSDVRNGTAYLSGTVETEIDKDLAREIALSIDGIERVENNLRVEADADYDKGSSERTFGQRIEDATTTAIVKSKLLANEHTHGLRINVDTTNDVVTLRGNVKSSEERSLAENLVANTEDVDTVVNELKVVEDNS